MTATPYPRLLGDVGGTNARFAVQDALDGPPQRVRTYKGDDYATLAQKLTVSQGDQTTTFGLYYPIWSWDRYWYRIEMFGGEVVDAADRTKALFDGDMALAAAFVSGQNGCRFLAALGQLARDLHQLRKRAHGLIVHLHDHVLARERGERDARVARRRMAHRVEEVGDGAHAAVEREVRLGRGRVGVAGGDRDPKAHELVDQLERARQLGRERDLGDVAGTQQAAQQRDVG